MRAAARVRVRYRGDDGELVDTSWDRLDVGAVVSGEPVRRFCSYRGQRHYSGWYWSATMGRLLAYESRLELSRLVLADFDPAVVGIAAQPFQLTGPDGDRIRVHVPDLVLVGADGAVTVVDVKHPGLLEDPRVRAQFGWTRRVAAARGWGVEAWSGAPEALLGNVRFLAGYRRSRLIDPDVLAGVRSAVTGPVAVGVLERRLARTHRPGSVRPAVLHALWRGDLSVDLSAPLGSGSVVRGHREAVDG